MCALQKDTIDAIAKSWAEVRKDTKQSGIDLFCAFFTHFPQYKDLFEDFRNVSLENLRTDPKVRMHGVRVIYALSSLVDSLDDLEVAAGIMRKTVDNHHRRGIKQKDYENLFSLMPTYLEAKAGDKFGTTARQGWEAVLKVLLDVSKARLEELSSNS